MSCKEPNISAEGKYTDELIYHNFADKLIRVVDTLNKTLTLRVRTPGANRDGILLYLTKRDVEALAKHYDLLEEPVDVASLKEDAYNEGYEAGCLRRRLRTL